MLTWLCVCGHLCKISTITRTTMCVWAPLQDLQRHMHDHVCVGTFARAPPSHAEIIAALLTCLGLLASWWQVLPWMIRPQHLLCKSRYNRAQTQIKCDMLVSAMPFDQCFVSKCRCGNVAAILELDEHLTRNFKVCPGTLCCSHCFQMHMVVLLYTMSVNHPALTASFWQRHHTCSLSMQLHRGVTVCRASAAGT